MSSIQISEHIAKDYIKVDTKAHKVVEHELYRDYFYLIHSEQFIIKRENHISNTIAYFMRDINY